MLSSETSTAMQLNLALKGAGAAPPTVAAAQRCSGYGVDASDAPPPHAASARKAAAFRAQLAAVAASGAPPPPLAPLSFAFTPVAARYLQLMHATLVGTLFSAQVGRWGGGAGGCALGSVVPFDAAERRGGQDWPPVGHTMVGELRLQNVREAVEAVVRLGVPGDFAELGVWRGGVCIYAKAILDLLCEGRGAPGAEGGRGARDVIVFDAFEDIPGYGGITTYLSVSEELVRGAFEKYGGGADGVVFVKGLFKDSLPAFREARIKAGGKPIAVLRVDGNFYDSHQDTLYYLYDFVPVGGVVIFDDYTHVEAQQAWRDFQADQGFSENVTKIELPDKNGAWLVKTRAVETDFSKMRPARDCNMRARALADARAGASTRVGESTLADSASL
jgi:hypothetical protein